MRTGRCECGAVAYRSEGPWRDIITCHCQECRRQSGHYWAATAVPKDALEMVEARGLRWIRMSDMAERGFCAKCGSGVFYRPDHKGYVAIGAGTLDDTNGLTHIEEVFVAEAGDYYPLAGDVPRHEAFSAAWKSKDGAGA